MSSPCTDRNSDPETDSGSGSSNYDTEEPVSLDTEKPLISTWYNVEMDPMHSDMSDHSSDDQPYEEPESDLEEAEEELDNTEDLKKWCSCDECVVVINAGSALFCCHGIDRVEQMRGELKCITQAEDFIKLILDKKVLHLVSYSVNKKGCVDPKNTEKFNRMLRFTGYKSFLNILELQGLGKNRRYALPACVVHRIRETYPSLNGIYTGFKSVIGEEGQDGHGNETLQTF